MFNPATIGTLAAGLNSALKSAYGNSKKDHEKHYVKTMLDKSFLDAVRADLNRCLLPGWTSRVASAYVDTHPRTEYIDAAGNKNSIEIGDILFIKNVYRLSSPTAALKEGRALLMQAKRTSNISPNSPPVDANNASQHFFSSNWPPFDLKLDAGLTSFHVANSSSLEWWALVWSQKGGVNSPSSSPWLASTWLAADTHGFSLGKAVSPDYIPMGDVISELITDNPKVGLNFVEKPVAAGTVGQWDELVTELISYCNPPKKKRVKRYETSSFLSYAMLYDHFSGLAYQEYMNDYRRRASESRNAEDKLSDSNKPGFLTVTIDLVELGEREHKYEYRPWQWRGRG